MTEIILVGQGENWKESDRDIFDFSTLHPFPDTQCILLTNN